jgi:hypothetical protein
MPTMTSHSYDSNAEERLAWLADRAAQTFADDPAAARRWLEQPRRDLAGFTPAQCALLGGAPMQRVTTLLARAGGPGQAARVPTARADVARRHDEAVPAA